MNREEMLDRIQATLNESEDYCARCQHCDRQLDAVMAVVWPEVERLQVRQRIATTNATNLLHQVTQVEAERDALKAAAKEEGSSSSGGAP